MSKQIMFRNNPGDNALNYCFGEESEPWPVAYDNVWALVGGKDITIALYGQHATAEAALADCRAQFPDAELVYSDDWTS